MYIKERRVDEMKLERERERERKGRKSRRRRDEVEAAAQVTLHCRQPFPKGKYEQWRSNLDNLRYYKVLLLL